jgi:hypothetical protein
MAPRARILTLSEWNHGNSLKCQSIVFCKKHGAVRDEPFGAARDRFVEALPRPDSPGTPLAGKMNGLSSMVGSVPAFSRKTVLG